MTLRIFTFTLSMLCLSLIKTNAQSADSAKVRDFVVLDTLNAYQPKAEVVDTVAWLQGESVIDKNTAKIINSKKVFTPSSKNAVLYALIPGGGQFYNRKYWKLPIVYGGFIGLAYAISWNGKYYGEYKDAYAAIMKEDPFAAENVAVWKPFLTPGTDMEALNNPSNIVRLRSSFKRSRDSYRRYRDLSIIGVVALYALTMIDAYVDAELFDFDISPDLSLRVEPVNIKNSSRLSDNALGIQCSLRF